MTKASSLVVGTAAVLMMATAMAAEPPFPKLAQAASFTVQANILNKGYTVSRMEVYSHKLAKFRVDTIERQDRDYSYQMETTSQGIQRPKAISDHEHDEGRTRDLRRIVDFKNGHYYKADIYNSQCYSYLMDGVTQECNITNTNTGETTTVTGSGSEASKVAEADKRSGHGKSGWEYQSGIRYDCHWKGVPPMISTAQLFHWGAQFPATYLGKSNAVDGVLCNRWQSNITSFRSGKNYTLDYYFVDPDWRQHINRREAESLPEGYGIPARAVLKSSPLAGIPGGTSEDFPTFTSPLLKDDVYHVYDFHDYTVGEPHYSAFLLPCEFRDKIDPNGNIMDNPAGMIDGNCTEIHNKRCYEQPGMRSGTRQEAAFIGGVLGALFGICCTSCLFRWKLGQEATDSRRNLI